MSRPELRILSLGGVGDAVLLTACIREWRQQHPEGRLITYCADEKLREVLLGNPHIDSLRLVGRWRFWLHGLVPVLRRRFFKRVAAANYGTIFPSVSYTISAARIIAELLGIKMNDDTMEIHLSEEEMRMGREHLVGLRNPVAFHTRATSTQNKLWTDESWQTLVQNCPEYTFVQVGDRVEPPVSGAVDLRGLPLREAFATIKHCSALVGLESAFAHAAAALGVPAVVLFGPSNPEVWGHPTAINLYARRRCSPCIDTLGRSQCPYDRACMRSIQVQEVSTSLAKVLAARGVLSPHERS